MSEVDGSLAVNRLRLSAVKLHTLFLWGAMPMLLMAMLGGGATTTRSMMMRIFGVDQLKIMIILFEIDQKESLPSLADCFTQLSHIVYCPRRRIVTAWRNFSLVLMHL